MTDLRADCSRCVGLCCVAPAFAASADFAVDKPAGQPCRHLGGDHRCTIHDRLRERGFPGCTVYDCFGAGQQVTQVTFGGRTDWRRTPAMLTVFPVVRQLHELLWYLAEALELPAAAPLHDSLRVARSTVEALAAGTPEELAALDGDAVRDRVNALLREASALARAGRRGRDPSRDLVGRDLRRIDLRCASLRGALLLGADLRGSNLSGADVTGADLRGADLRGADLRGTIFLTQAQLDSATGDAATRIPPKLTRPAHWISRRHPGSR